MVLLVSISCSKLISAYESLHCIGVKILYFGLLLLIAQLTTRKANNESFYGKQKQCMVCYCIWNDWIEHFGITFISVQVGLAIVILYQMIIGNVMDILL